MSLDLLFPHFETLIRTPEDVARLNQVILGLAVQGKLVPQDPADELASELLKRIRAEKQRLVKEGKLEESKVSRRIEPAAMPYELPESWEWVRLGNLAESMSNGIYKPANFYDDDGVACLRMYNIQDGRISFHDLKRMDLTGSEIATYGLREGDLLVNRVNSRELVGKAAVIPVIRELLVYESKNIRVRFLGELTEAHFINVVFRTSVVKTEFEQSAKQTTGQASINQAQLNDLMVPLPPLAEQRRIVAKVESLFAQTRALEVKLRQARDDLVTVNRAALHRLSAATDAGAFAAAWATVRDAFDLLYDDPRNVVELRQAILQLAVQGKLVPQDSADEPASELLKRIQAERRRLVKEGKVREEKAVPSARADELFHALPPGWTRVQLDAITLIRTGSTPRRGESKYYENGDIPWITSSVTGAPFITQASEFITEVALKETNCQIYPKHTLIVAMYGQGKTRGQVSELLIDAATNQACAALVFHGIACEIRPYVKIFHQKNYRELRSLAEGGAQPNLNIGKIKATLIPLPPLAEQHRIVARVDQLMRLCDALEAGLARAEGARRALTAAVLGGAA
ncbi:MAG: restriction endonuclease subunit S [Anaerolineae bacterium]